ncbi:MAG: hypothetical protein IIV14_00735 [Bacteroidaceae bacterium]|nr:hypothetical protein [Bacteroidaceae bacterium]
MTLEYLRTLSDEELLELSKQKNRKGNNTVDAEKAMRVRRERSGHWDEVHGQSRGFLGDEIAYRGSSGFVKKFK